MASRALTKESAKWRSGLNVERVVATGRRSATSALTNSNDVHKSLSWRPHPTVQEAGAIPPPTSHDLKATGVTWMAVREDDPLKPQTRAGHRTCGTTQGYMRFTESLRQVFGAPFRRSHGPKPIRLIGLDVQQRGCSGEGGIRTRGRLPYARLASGYHRPLGHLSGFSRPRKVPRCIQPSRASARFTTNRRAFRAAVTE